VNRATSVEVIISREVIDRATGNVAAAAPGKVDPQRKLLVQVIPKAQFTVIGEDRVELDPPAPGQQHPPLYFDLRATHTGEGEVWVVARQGQVPLVTLMLRPRIVETQGQKSRRMAVSATTPEAPRLAEPLDQLLIVEQRNGDEVTYFYQLQSPRLNILDKYYSLPFKGDRHQYIANLYQQIEQRWLSTEQDSTDFTEELRAFGAELFDKLFPETMQRILWEHRQELKRIMVISTEPFIPWELVHLKEPGKSLGAEIQFLGQMGLVRWLHDMGWPPSELKIREGMARYVIPHYPHPDYVLPEAQLEAQFLEDKFKAQAVDPRSTPVRKLLSQPGAFDLLHFACHGMAEGDNVANAQLLLQGRVEGNNYIPDPLSATTAEQYANLTRPDNSRPIVVLNACQAGRAGYRLTGIGGFAKAFLRGGAGAFVGTLWSVGDSPARTFTETFYSEILAGAKVSEAAIRAREKAQQAGDATWLAYVVYGHPHATLAQG
jgi:hypothetical protein